jgi:hypothetical protein
MNINEIQNQFIGLRDQFNTAKGRFKPQAKAMKGLCHEIDRLRKGLVKSKSSPSEKIALKNIVVEQRKLVKEFKEIQKNRSVLGRAISKFNGAFKSSEKKIAHYVQNKGIFKKTIEKRTQLADSLCQQFTHIPSEISGKVERTSQRIQSLNAKMQIIRTAAKSQIEVLQELQTMKTSLENFERSYIKEIKHYAVSEKIHPDLIFARARLTKIRKDIAALEDQLRTKDMFENVFCVIAEDPTSYIHILNQVTEIKNEMENRQLFVERHLSDEQRVLRETTCWERFIGVHIKRMPAPAIPASHREAEALLKIAEINEQALRINHQIDQRKNVIEGMNIAPQHKLGSLGYCNGKLQRVASLQAKLNEKNTYSEMLMSPAGQPFPVVSEIERELTAIERRIECCVQNLTPPAINGTELEKKRKRAEKKIEEFADTENSFYLDGIKLSIGCVRILRNYVNDDALFDIESAYQELEKVVGDFNVKLQEVSDLNTLEAKVQGLHALFQSEEYAHYSQAALNFSLSRKKLETILAEFSKDAINYPRYVEESSVKLSTKPEDCFICYVQRPPRHVLLVTELIDMASHCQIENFNADELETDGLNKCRALVAEMNTNQESIEINLYLDKLNSTYPNGITYKQYVNLLLHSASPAFNPHMSSIVRQRLDVLLKRNLLLKAKSEEKAERLFKEQKMQAINEFYKRKAKPNSGVFQSNVPQCDIELKAYMLQVVNNPLESGKNKKFVRKFLRTFPLLQVKKR